MDMPEKIAAWRFDPTKADEWIHGGWSEDHDHKTTEYTRSDLAVEVKPLTFEDASGVAMLGRYVAFDAETPIGRVSYGTDAEGEHWYAYPGMARNALHTSAASLEDAKSKAVAGYEKSLLSHPVASAWNTRPDDLRSKLQALVTKWEGMTCRTKCAQELREVLEGEYPRPHEDDKAVDRFAAAMKAKLAKKRAQGRGGWENKDECSQEFLSTLLREHIEKGDPVDVANLAMMLHQRGEAVSSLREVLEGGV